jgi:hypothetical protein
MALMNPDLQVLLSGALGFGILLILALRELRSRRRGNGGGWSRDAPPPAAPPPPQGGSDRPLPDCLIPKPMARPAARRPLEPA